MFVLMIDVDLKISASEGDSEVKVIDIETAG